MVDGTSVPREFIVALPKTYDPNRPYRLVFAFHGLTGKAEQVAGTGFGGAYFGVASHLGESSILVAPQGLAPEDEPDQYGWPNTDGRDIDFIRAMVAWLGSKYCVDQSRLFSLGFSYGGMISNTIGCQLADVFRGVLPMAGAVFGRTCSGPPVAVWMTHGTADTSVTFAQGEAARDAFLAKNHCDAAAQPTPVEPAGCVSYSGCDAGYPVVWCPHDGAHRPPNFAGQAMSNFITQF